MSRVLRDDPSCNAAGITADRWAIGFGLASVVLGVVAVCFRVKAAKRRALAASGGFDGLGSAGGLGDAAAAGRSPKHPKLLQRHKTGGMTLSMYADSEMPIDMRVGLIQDLTRESATHPEIIALAQAIVGSGSKRVRVGKYEFQVQGANCGNNSACKIDAIGKWTAKNVRYTGDIAPVRMGQGKAIEAIDLFQAARRTLEIGGGDCDDQVVVNCSLVEALGDSTMKCMHRVTAPRADSDWAHIYAVGQADGKQMAMDTTLPGYRTGREAPHARQANFKAY